MIEDAKNYVLYIFVNTEMPSMNPGKAQAHSGFDSILWRYTVPW